MSLLDHSTFLGANQFAGQPVIRFAVKPLPGGMEIRDRSILDRLLGYLPTLVEGERTASGGCPASAIPGAFTMAHVVEHVCLALQNSAGASLTCVHGQNRQVRLEHYAIVPFEEHQVCLEAAELAIFLTEKAVAIEPVDPAGAPTATLPELAAEFSEHLTRFQQNAQRLMLPVQDRAMIATARARDIPADRLAGRTIVLGQGRYQQRLSASKTTTTNVVGNDLAANKDYARRVLSDLGLPNPQYARVYRAADAIAAAEQIGYPVVVKPNNGSMGHGVSVNVKNRREVREAYKRARPYSRSVLVEAMVKGSDYRMLVINGKLCAAARRVPGHVVGDGKHTIEQLVEQTNADPRRGDGPMSSWTRLSLDEQAERLLSELGYTRASMPPAGEEVFLRRNANTSDGGTAVDVTDQVHPDNRDIAERAALAIGLDVAGVDLLTTDIAVSMWQNGGQICEVNSRPGLRKHIWPAVGESRDVTIPIIDMLFPSDRPCRVPVVVVIGATNELTSATAHSLAHVMSKAGHHVGLATPSGNFSGGRPTTPAILTAPEAARRVLLDPKVDLAVLQIDWESALQGGLGVDAINVSVVVDRIPSPSPATVGANSRQEALEMLVRWTRDSVVLFATDGVAPPIRIDGKICHATLASSGSDTSGFDWHVPSESQEIAIVDGDQRARIPVACAQDSKLVRAVALASAAAFSLGTQPELIARAINSYLSPEENRHSAHAV